MAGASYGLAGEIARLNDDGRTEKRTYNSLYQLTRMTVTGLMDMQYVYTAGQNNGRIAQSVDGISGETVVYTYDTLNRLTKAETTSAAWGDAYNYHGFGNLTGKTPTKGNAPALSVLMDAATNRPLGGGYDANGNPPVGGPGLYPYDVENRLLLPASGFAGWTYDASGKRVLAETPRGYPNAASTTCEIYFYGIGGQKLATYSCGYNDQDGGNGAFWYMVKNRNLYFGGKLMRSTVVTDRLGSVRARRNGGGWDSLNYWPYGEERTSTANGWEKFGTYFRDANGVDYADQRYYASGSGRFMTADPSGMGSVNMQNPTSWNMYSYVTGDPVNLNDPTGLEGNPYETCTINGITYPFSCADMVGGFRPPPQQTVWGRALGRLSAAQEGIANRSTISADCQSDLDALSALSGKTIDLATIQGAVSSTNFENGTISKLPVSALGGTGFGAYGAAVQAARDAKYGSGQTIGNDFARNPNGLTAETVLGGNTIFANPVLIGNNLNGNMALLFHEALHELGLIDEQIQEALGFKDFNDTSDTKRITTKLQKDCITGKGNR